MNKPVVIGTVVAVVVVVGGATLLLTNKKTGDDGMKMPATSSTSTKASSTTPTATNQVALQNFAFSPADITIKKGTTVTWTNNDSVAHTVTESDGQNGPNSGNLDPGKTFVFTFDTPGTYKYHCTIHSQMTGTVTVTE